MMWLVVVLSVAAGWLLADGLAGRVFPNPWMRLAGSLGLGILIGPGLASVLFFGIGTLGLASATAVFGVIGLLTAVSAGVYWKFREPSSVSESSNRVPWTWALVATLAIACVLLVLNFKTVIEANPNGEWDASAIWNLRAKFLAGGANLWSRAIAPDQGSFMTGSSHPTYPLFLSSFIAMQWIVAGGFSAVSPAAMTALASAALVLLVVAGVGRRSIALGLLAGLVLIASELVVSQTAAQYADLLQALAFLATLVLLDAASETDSWKLLLAAGLAIGLAPWIKNEGQPFVIAAIGVTAWRFRRRAVWVLAGAIPGIAATAALKLMAVGRETILPGSLGEALAKIVQPGRWIQTVAGFGTGLIHGGELWAHPVLLVAALALALQFVPGAERRGRIWLTIPIAVVLAADFGIFLITTADLAWHLSTSVDRLLAQVWPSLLWLTFSMLRTPEEYFPKAPEPVPVGASRTVPSKRKRSGA